MSLLNLSPNPIFESLSRSASTTRFYSTRAEKGVFVQPASDRFVTQEDQSHTQNPGLVESHMSKRVDVYAVPGGASFSGSQAATVDESDHDVIFPGEIRAFFASS